MQPPRSEGLAEFTFKAVVAGILLGVVFGAANAYLGLRVGMTVSASIPAAVMTVALFKLVRARGTLLEANLSQTIGSASTSLASGTILPVNSFGMASPCIRRKPWSSCCAQASCHPTRASCSTNAVGGKWRATLPRARS